MRHLLFVMLLTMLTGGTATAGKRLTIKGVQYETAADNTATATMTVQAKGEVVILESVTMGKQRYLVTQIEEASFRKNSNVTAVLLPKSIKVIKTGAFSGCSKLEKLILPTGMYAIEKDAFAGCNSITTVEGNVSPFVAYKKTSGDQQLGIALEKPVVPKFSVMAKDQLEQRMTLWQAKKDYETVEQYKQRVTEENRQKRWDEYINELKQEYIALYAPHSLSTTLVGSYDPEYSVFTVQTMFFGNIFAQVPKADAAKFRQNYNKVEVLPKFAVQGDTLGIESCQFKLGDKVYDNVTNYANSGGFNPIIVLPPLDIDLAITEDNPTKPAPVEIDNAVDKNIPKSKQQNDKTFALIIGNEKYKRVASVPFANNDAKIFAEYCQKTLGLPANNVKLYQNAGLNDMRHAVEALVNTLKAYDGEAKAIVYYAGHGIPDESSRMPYLLPADGFATDIKSGYNLADLYEKLASAPSQMTMVLLDACFSGAKREGDMLADARAIALEVRSTMPTGNLLVFSASQGNETAYSDKRHGHGMFTYYLLKHLQETEGNTTVSNLTDYVISNVKRNSVLENEGKMQTPTIIPSSSLMSSWQDLKLK